MKEDCKSCKYRMEQSKSWVLEEERVIICEGLHDQKFLEKLIDERDLPRFQVKDAASWNRVEVGGVQGFGLALEKLIAVTGFKNLKGIAIVTDNDDKNALNNVKKALNKHFKKLKDYEYKPTKSEDLVSIQGKPVLIVLVPDSNHYGNLESLCLPAFYDHWSTAEKCANQFLKCTGAVSNWTNGGQLNKARVRAILSGYYKSEPYIGLGEIFKKTDEISTCHQCFEQLASALSRFDKTIEQKGP